LSTGWDALDETLDLYDNQLCGRGRISQRRKAAAGEGIAASELAALIRAFAAS
jgi:hypothetical protein